jgi:hypothetical protein
MNSPLARVIMSVLSGYLILLLLLTVHDWYQKEFPSPPPPTSSSKRVQHPFHHSQALRALQHFSRLPGSEKSAIKSHLDRVLLSTERWLADLPRSNYKIICLGEVHEESTRAFLADRFFSKLPIDVLMLETTPDGLNRLIRRMEAGRRYFPLLDADIMSILHTVRAINPDVEIFGIDETDKQQENQNDPRGARDKSIARNFWSRYTPGSRHLILFGASHCANEPNWLFSRLCKQAPLPLSDQMLNVQVLEEHQRGPLEAFVYFLDEIGLEKKDFVIADTAGLHPRIYELFPLLDRQILKKYLTLIVFRT